MMLLFFFLNLFSCGLTVSIDYDVVVSTEAPVSSQYGKSLEFCNSIRYSVLSFARCDMYISSLCTLRSSAGKKIESRQWAHLSLTHRQLRVQYCAVNKSRINNIKITVSGTSKIIQIKIT